MNREFRIAIAVFALLGATGCQGVLDVTPKDQFPDAAVFSDPNLAQAFLNDTYRGMGHGLYEIMLASMTDETHFIHNYNTEVVVQSLITSSARGALDDGRFFFSSRRRHTRWTGDWSSDVCSSD